MRTNTLAGAEARALLGQVFVNMPEAPALVRQIYELRKKENPRISLEWLCQRSGIPTKSNLSEIMKGRRRLSRKHVASLARALGLQGIFATCFSRVWEHEIEKNAEKKASLMHEINLLKKAIAIEVIENALEIHPFTLHVFCALGLFSNRASESELVRYFKSHPPQAVPAALDELLRQNLVTVDPEGRYCPTVSQIKFGGHQSFLPQVNYIRQAMTEAADKAEKHWKSETAFFDSMIISVNQEKFAHELKRFRETVLQYQSSFEVSPADTLIRFNVQIYPVD